jgi:hypothetical protein
MTWKNIRLELAGTPEFPGGSVSRGYLMRLPLNDSDFVDWEAVDRHPRRATVRRFWSTQPDESGLVHKTKEGWAMQCNGSGERMLDVDGRPVRLGAQVSVCEIDGRVLPFKVASIR